MTTAVFIACGAIALILAAAFELGKYSEGARSRRDAINRRLAG
jgi:hypothetical protein